MNILIVSNQYLISSTYLDVVDTALEWSKTGKIPSVWRADIKDVIEDQCNDDDDEDDDEEVDEEEKAREKAKVS